MIFLKTVSWNLKEQLLIVFSAVIVRKELNLLQDYVSFSDTYMTIN